METSVTPLETIRLASMGSLVTIPGFSDGQTFNVRLRKPNMLTLIKLGKIPNELLNVAVELFEGKQKDGNKNYAEMCGILAAFCEASLVEPTYKEMTDVGIELTMEQMMFIFKYTQGGVKSLKPFRDESADLQNTGDGNEVSVPTEHAA